MWEDIEARIAENDADKAVPLRREFLGALKETTLRPVGDSKKMVAVEDAGSIRLVWEITGSAQSFYLHTMWKSICERAGFECKSFPYEVGKKDGARHSNLNRPWSFKETDCVQVTASTLGELRELLSALGVGGDELYLDPLVITRWIERLRTFFPGLDRFDSPNEEFDAAERNYKLKTMAFLKDAIPKAADDKALVDAVLTAAKDSNVLVWQTYDPLNFKGGEEKSRLIPAVAELARAAFSRSEDHPQALEKFASDWELAVPDGSADSARQIGEFLFFHLHPNDAVYIRHTVRKKLWQESVGLPFPSHESLAETYRDELRFMRAVRKVFEQRGLSPRDLIDIQGALWVVASYTDDLIPLDRAFDRASIERAMDAYDQYLRSREHREIFDAFGNPRDFWVRSTRERKNRVYPSKQIVGFVLQKTTLNGGWGQKYDAASRLHNAGYIIVDENDDPVVPPQNYAHIVRGSDRIALVAVNYYIAPAREWGESSVSIRVGSLGDEMGLASAAQEISTVLESRKFRAFAKVTESSRSEGSASDLTEFTFNLVHSSEGAGVNEKNGKHEVHNLILYGPPGTGKTYQTVWEAVRLCLGQESADALRGPNNRPKLMEQFKRLIDDGRIEFVTFHQSMSYEEFVEGLRPSITSDDGESGSDAGNSGGFRLKPHDGVFKRVSERARLDVSETDELRRLDRSRRIFKISLGRRSSEEERIQFGLQNNLIHLGWASTIDWSDERYESWQEIRKKLEEVEGTDVSPHSGELVCTYSFRVDLEVGDYVIVSDGRDRFRAVGKVTGEYFYNNEPKFHPHRRKVEWLWKNDAGSDRSIFYPKPFRQHSCYRLDEEAVDWDALEGVALGQKAKEADVSARDFVLIIDEINRANISKVLGELITVLEPDKRLGMENELRVTLPYSKKSFGVPSNLHIIGTMNTADRSIALLDTALRRRFKFKELMPDPMVLAQNVGGINLRKLLSKINDRVEYLFDREHQIGHAYFTGCQSRDDVEDVMRHKVIPLLAEYFYEDWSKVAAVLGDTEHERPRFLVRERIAPPEGMENGSFSGDRFRWRVKPERDDAEGGGFDFSEFSA